MDSAFSIQPVDGTPKALALTVIGCGAALWLLKYYGFRFNFGVAGAGNGQVG